MQARFLPLHARTRQKLVRLKQEAERGGAYRVARRFHAVLLNNDGYSSGQIAALLGAPRSRIFAWLASYQQNGGEGLQEGAHTGRPPALDSFDRGILADILDSGPVAYGFLSGVWTSPMVSRVLEEEFGIGFHTSHVCRLLHELGFSVQRPQRLLACADAIEQARWRQHVYPGIKASCRPGAVLLFEDEASFRQDSTLHQTWVRKGHQPRVPVTGERKSVKVFGCVEVYSARFLFHYEPVFNAKPTCASWNAWRAPTTRAQSTISTTVPRITGTAKSRTGFASNAVGGMPTACLSARRRTTLPSRCGNTRASTAHITATSRLCGNSGISLHGSFAASSKPQTRSVDT
jgi:transposase